MREVHLRDFAEWVGALIGASLVLEMNSDERARAHAVLTGASAGWTSMRTTRRWTRMLIFARGRSWEVRWEVF